jgi:hypothetical protein
LISLSNESLINPFPILPIEVKISQYGKTPCLLISEIGNVIAAHDLMQSAGRRSPLSVIGKHGKVLASHLERVDIGDRVNSHSQFQSLPLDHRSSRTAKF